MNTYLKYNIIALLLSKYTDYFFSAIRKEQSIKLYDNYEQVITDQQLIDSLINSSRNIWINVLDFEKILRYPQKLFGSHPIQGLITKIYRLLKDGRLISFYSITNDNDILYNGYVQNKQLYDPQYVVNNYGKSVIVLVSQNAKAVLVIKKAKNISYCDSLSPISAKVYYQEKMFFLVTLNSKVGVVNDAANLCVPIVYEEITAHGEYFVVGIKNKYGLLSLRKGCKLFIPIQYDNISFFASFIILEVDKKRFIVNSVGFIIQEVNILEENYKFCDVYYLLGSSYNKYISKTNLDEITLKEIEYIDCLFLLQDKSTGLFGLFSEKKQSFLYNIEWNEIKFEGDYLMLSKGVCYSLTKYSPFNPNWFANICHNLINHKIVKNLMIAQDSNLQFKILKYYTLDVLLNNVIKYELLNDYVLILTTADGKKWGYYWSSSEWGHNFGLLGLSEYLYNKVSHLCEDLYVVEYKNLQGIIDPEGNILLKCCFKEISVRAEYYEGQYINNGPEYSGHHIHLRIDNEEKNVYWLNSKFFYQQIKTYFPSVLQYVTKPFIK